MARRRNPYYALPQDIRDKLRELVGGQRMWVPRDREQIRARDREIVRRFTQMHDEDGLPYGKTVEAIAKSFYVSRSCIEKVVRKRTP